ncbi:RNA polymerase sigma factor [Maribacter cobaltidurans]|uniref:Uncharacterized protein n=1 Tax=Maribacter cobaltidurans TaxID=1178778 RepID=A0A223V6G5_9FLAO|nr:RNA polymerase subunit sigma-70 [Maribacter cobaltidurans]ASV30797.1 hypothetical protein CJ263_11540 [Maribacter cobaltidurans]GGD81835.1 hypothetical protein GCM10011412_19530 [Maribacter cobaltidurans]
MEKEINKQTNQGTIQWEVKETYSKLVDFRKKDNRQSFNNELLRLMPQVKNYVAKRLRTAILSGKLNKGMFSPNDFTDQLFIEVYDNWDSIRNESYLRPYLFKKVDELLDDSLTEEEFDHVFFENIDTFSQPEWDTMEEDFSTDGDGDLVMLEELDDKSLIKDNYTLNHVFVSDDEKELAEKLDRSLDKERVERHIQMVLGKMSLPMRSVFQLATDQGFTLNEIASIKDATLDEVDDLLTKARRLLKDSFVKRFLVDSN